VSEAQALAPKVTRGARTRQAIVGAGRALFAARAVDAVAIDEIVREAGVSKGAFYNHFDDKDALVGAIAGEIRAGVESIVRSANDRVDDPARRVVRAVCVYLRYALDEPERAGVMLRLHDTHIPMASPLNQGLMDDIAAGLSSGRFEIAGTEAGALFVMGVALAGLGRIAREPSPAAATGLAQQLCALLLRGLGVPPLEATSISARASDELVRSPHSPSQRPLAP
jgi:AcrR family transcriptional regulator